VPSWLLASLIFVVWCLWAVAAVAQRPTEDARRGTPAGQRGGVSILPGIPVFPVVLWGIARMIDRPIDPCGTWTVVGAHGVFAACLVVSFVLDWRYHRSVDGAAGRGR
jgi:hypothetical protein